MLAASPHPSRGCSPPWPAGGILLRPRAWAGRSSSRGRMEGSTSAGPTEGSAGSGDSSAGSFGARPSGFPWSAGVSRAGGWRVRGASPVRRLRGGLRRLRRALSPRARHGPAASWAHGWRPRRAPTSCAAELSVEVEALLPGRLRRERPPREEEARRHPAMASRSRARAEPSPGRARPAARSARGARRSTAQRTRRGLRACSSAPRAGRARRGPSARWRARSRARAASGLEAHPAPARPGRPRTPPSSRCPPPGTSTPRSAWDSEEPKREHPHLRRTPALHGLRARRRRNASDGLPRTGPIWVGAVLVDGSDLHPGRGVRKRPGRSWKRPGLGGVRGRLSSRGLLAGGRTRIREWPGARRRAEVEGSCWDSALMGEVDSTSLSSGGRGPRRGSSHLLP